MRAVDNENQGQLFKRYETYQLHPFLEPRPHSKARQDP